MTNWLLATTTERFEALRARGFDVAAVDEGTGRELERVRPGDRVLFYLHDADAIGAVTRATGTQYQDSATRRPPTQAGEEHPLRFAIEVTVACEPGAYVAVGPVAGDLDTPPKPGAPGWRLARADAIHELSDADVEVLEGAVRLASGASPTA